MTLRILLIDDDEVDRMAVLRALTASGLAYDITEHASSAAGLRALREAHFDCVLLDYNLPGRNGIETLREAVAEGVRAPFVMLTGQGSEEAAVELMKAGAADYISKAFLSPERLARAIVQASRLAKADQQLRDTEIARKRSEERFRCFVEATSHIVWTTNAAGQIVEDSPTWRSFLGARHPLDSLCGWLSGVHHDDEPDARFAWERAVAQRHPVDVEFRLQRHDGAWRSFQARGVPVLNDDGTVREWVGTAIDITEKKEAQAQALQQAGFEKQLIGIVSHDLRGPLTVISMSAETLQAMDLPERAKKSATRITLATTRANRMISDLLDLTRARSGVGMPLFPKLGDMHEAAKRAMDEAKTVHGARIKLITNGAGGGHWDFDRIEQALDNLIHNAFKYGDSQREVTVTSTGTSEGVTLEVLNWGAPVPPKLAASLFQPFSLGRQLETTARTSLGLGLFIVQEIVTAHGGRVSVTSSAEDGTRFCIRLPRSAKPNTPGVVG